MITGIINWAQRESPRAKYMACGDSKIWKRDPAGTFGWYLKSRYGTLKYCGFVIYV